MVSPYPCLESPEVLEAASKQERRDAAHALVSRLGSSWSVRTVAPHLLLVHVPTKSDFVVVPGGRFTMGLREEDVEEASEYTDWSSGVAAFVDEEAASAHPAHEVLVAPFLCARTLPTDSMSRAEAKGWAKERGFRLPSEAELEWLMRDGGRYGLVLGARAIDGKPGAFTFRPSRFGVDGLVAPQWAEDDWHDRYEGAPSTSNAWAEGDPAGVCRNDFVLDAMVSEDDVACLLAALRRRGGEQLSAMPRLVCDLL